MIPAPLAGAALLALAWMVLWWLAGGRKPLSPISCATISVAAAVLALDKASDGRALAAAMCIAGCIIWAANAGDRARKRATGRRLDDIVDAVVTRRDRST